MKNLKLISAVSVLALLLGAGIAFGGNDYRGTLSKDLEDFKQQIQQHKNIWDKAGQIINEKTIKQQELTQQMIALDNKIKQLQSEINTLKTTQENSTNMAKDLRLKLSITEKHLKDYDSNFLKESARQ